MSYTVEAIGPGEMTAGFALAGVPVVEVATDEEGIAKVLEALARPDLAVVLADESVLAALPAHVKRRAARQTLPVLVPVPRPRFTERTEEVESYLLDLLQRAIGYRMRLK